MKNLRDYKITKTFKITREEWEKDGKFIKEEYKKKFGYYPDISGDRYWNMKYTTPWFKKPVTKQKPLDIKTAIWMYNTKPNKRDSMRSYICGVLGYGDNKQVRQPDYVEREKTVYKSS
jgi:hypothetical protein